MKSFKKAQGNAAGIVILIAVFIVIYILLLPPTERCKLLDTCETSSSSGVIPGSTGTTPGTLQGASSLTLLDVNPGRLSYQARDTYEYDLNAVTISAQSNAYVFSEVSSFSISNSWFGKRDRTLNFDIEDIDNIENVILSFSAPRREGRLIVDVNGHEIYDFPVASYTVFPISIDRNLLQERNNLTLSVSGVGLRFWTSNEYLIENLKVIGDVIDISKQESLNTFYIPENQFNSVREVNLRFNPECSRDRVGVLEINLNGKIIHSGVPDCGVLNRIYLSPNDLNQGTNRVTFRTSRGIYLIDQIQVRTRLEEARSPTYYFSIGSEYFSMQDSPKRCGDVDGYCPSNCAPEYDKDCCFEKYPNGYWCKAVPSNFADRCVGSVTTLEQYSRCITGYEDRRGNPPKDFEELCGDDTDKYCPLGCGIHQDKDCCKERYEDGYWCENMPINGLDYVCVNQVSSNHCEICPGGYKALGSKTPPRCEPSVLKEEVLLSNYNVILNISFTNPRDWKEAIFYINAYEFGFDTRDSYWEREINSYVESGTNSIEIVPKSDLDIRKIEVLLKKR